MRKENILQARLASHKGMISLGEWWSSRASVFLARIETQSTPGEELRRRRTLLPSVLRPQGGAFKVELCPPSRPGVGCIKR